MIPLSPATRIYLAAGVTDLRNHSVRLIIPSSARKDSKTGVFPGRQVLMGRNNQSASRKAKSWSIGRKRPDLPWNCLVLANACSLSSRLACR